MLAEDHVGDSTLGVTATTIIAEQFSRLRDGDRFFYQNVFRGRELDQIERTTLADVIERNTSIEFRRDTNVFFSSNDGLQNDDANDGRRNDRGDNDRTPPVPPPIVQGAVSAQPVVAIPAEPVDQVFAALAANANQDDAANQGDADDDDIRRRRRR